VPSKPQRLRCKECGGEWERPSVRGRLPERCDVCRKRPCEVCGAKTLRKRFCSDGCRASAPRKHPRGECSVCTKPMQWSPKTSAAVDRMMCRPCRAAQPKPFAHGTRTGYRERKCRCDECRAWLRQSMRDYYAKRLDETGWSHAEYKAERRRQEREERNSPSCSVCGRPVVRDSKHFPMHATCWRNEYRAQEDRRAARLRAAQRRLDKAARGVPANHRWPLVNGTCGWCDEQFTRRGSATGYCSKACRLRSQGKWKIAKRVRRAIYERDQWTCQICMEAVDPDATDEWRPTLDHIVPRSHDGSDDPSNLRLAHLWCNSVRGDLSYYSDEDLQAA
jgi:hypothetical protein